MLCSGSTRREGWKTLDSDPKHGPDFLASIPPLPAAVTRQEWDEIELIHGITTFEQWDVEPLLAALRTVLRPGGKLVLEQPDLYKVALAIVAAGPEGAPPVAWVFGDPSFHNPAHMNQWAYNPGMLSRLLRKVGFAQIEKLPAQHHYQDRDFRIEAYAP